MCQYCGCYEIATIKALMDEHVIIQNHCGDTQRAVRDGDLGKAVEALTKLVDVLTVHNQVEEKALYPAIGAVEEFSELTGKLYEEHDDSDAIFEQALATAKSDGPESADWPKVVEAIDGLYEHIIAEDNGLFPAAYINFDPEDWEACETAREEAEAGTAS